MSQWTDSAKSRLEDYFGRVRGGLRSSGADVEEVVDDLRRHVEEEVAAGNLGVVTEADVDRILASIGKVEGSAATGTRERGPEPSAAQGGRTASAIGRPGWVVLFFGVLLPLGTIGFEFLTGISAAELFNPMPSIAHILLVLLVPLGNLLVWLAVRRGAVEWRGKLGWVNGLVMGVSAVYALLYLPFSPFAIIGVLFYGLGLVPLAPALSFGAALFLRWHLSENCGPKGRLPGLWLGAVLGAIGVVVFSLPILLTEVGLQMAISDSVSESTRGVRLLRTWGAEEELLRACYGHTGGAGEIYQWGTPVSPEAARAIYYRVTGRPFNAVPPPKLYAGRARWNLLEEEFTWDRDMGGDAVAGRVKGLSLIHSRQDGVIDAEGALAYLEWTLEFKNVASVQREARAQILLPPGAVVSRLTLWIDGEEREAAFGGRSQVKAAYKEVVHVQRRDPVLVTTCGPDRVLLQCFPVQPSGGLMKVRLGITAPLVLTNAETGFLRWPHFLERNFSLQEDFQHSVWVEAKLSLESGEKRLTIDQKESGACTLHGEIAERALAAPQAALQVRRPAEARIAWTGDTRRGDGYVVRQTLTEKPVSAPERVVVVVDGTQGMGEHYATVAAALADMAPGIDFTLLLAADGYQELSGPLRRGDAALYREAGARLRTASRSGGHDNLSALIKAWDLAAPSPAAVVLWIHGPQPIAFETAEPLRQRFERKDNPPRLLEIQVSAGPNRVLEQLDGIPAVQSVVRLGDLRSDLQRLIKSWNGRSSVIDLVWDQVKPASVEIAGQGKETSLHLARLWAARETARLISAHRSEEAMKVAALYQLVTPVSGAVVLETKAQYERAGLEPVPASSVPMIPEPSAGVLWLFGLALLTTCRRRWMKHRH